MHVYSLLWVHVWITSFYNRPMLGVFNLDALHDLLSVGFIDLLVFLFMQYNMIAVTHLNLGCGRAGLGPLLRIFSILLMKQARHFSFTPQYKIWWSLRDSNPSPFVCQTNALPNELRPQLKS